MKNEKLEKLISEPGIFKSFTSDFLSILAEELVGENRQLALEELERRKGGRG